MLDRGNHCGSGDVWVCNSDGYVGQVCILRMGTQIQVRRMTSHKPHLYLLKKLHVCHEDFDIFGS